MRSEVQPDKTQRKSLSSKMEESTKKKCKITYKYTQKSACDEQVQEVSHKLQHYFRVYVRKVETLNCIEEHNRCCIINNTFPKDETI